MQPSSQRNGAGPLRVVQAGAGHMGRMWLTAIAQTPDVELVGLVDIDPDAARTAAQETGFGSVTVGADLIDVARASGAEAVIDVTVPQAHHPLTTAALFAGLPVLGEKPVAQTLPEALSLAAAARVTGVKFVVSQSRRYNAQAFAYREHVRTLGEVGTAVVQFSKAPHFPGFREQMEYPLLIDMAIHQFDLARFLLGRDPVSVWCDSFNPPGSWYAGDAAATAAFEMSGGQRFVFTGSWVAPGLETSWNGSWRITGSLGSALWDGDHDPLVETTGDAPSRAVVPGESVAGALAAFVAGLRGGHPMMCEVHDNVLSLAMVFAAIESAQSGRRVLIDDILEQAHTKAVAHEQRDDVRTELASWSTVRQALAE
ncbi:MAG: Gfo/Idh/MocA family protein [Beutenbergiaceae bacterium]